MPRSLITMLLSLLIFTPGCTGFGNFLPYKDRGIGGMSAFDFGATPVMTLRQEVGQLLVQPLLVLSRSHDGTVHIQNSSAPVDPSTISFRAPLLALFSCPIQPTLPSLSLR